MKRRNYVVKKIPRALMGILSLCLLIFSVTGVQAQSRLQIGDYQISGPHHHGALTLFLIHGKSTPHTIPLLTLEEAMERDLVKVYETGSVNQLTIENLSPDHEVFIQAGEIVKGGRQDRALGVDLTLAPNSGKVPIASFCVERGRWRKRGDEAVGEFSRSDQMVTSNNLRLAVRKGKNQSEVWSEVSVMQEKLSSNLGLQVNALHSDGVVVASESVDPQPNIVVNNIAVRDVMEVQDELLETFEQSVDRNQIEAASLLNAAYQPANRIVDNEQANRIVQQNVLQGRSRRISAEEGYTTSLQLSLENETLTEEINTYFEALRAIVEKDDDVIGFAFTINGEMKSADIYASTELFHRLWPKLLRAAATEAVAEKAEKEVVGSVVVVENCLKGAENGEGKEEKINDRIKVVTRENGESILFETQDSKNRNGWIHRNYMKLE